MKYLFALFVFLHVSAFCDPFVQNMEALLEGGERTELRYDVDQELLITIQKKHIEQSDFFIISFTTPEHRESEDEGAFMLVFPAADRSIGYLKWLHKISFGYSGTKLLEVLSEFCKQMQLKTVLLVDASEVVDEQCSCSLSLKHSHILLSKNSISWYESKGFQPISEATMASWFSWLLQDSTQPYHYFLPLPYDCYRTAAKTFAQTDCNRYLNALLALDEKTGFFTDQVELLRPIVEKSPTSTAKELYAVRDVRQDLLSVLDEPLSDDVKADFFSKIADSPSKDLSYASILLFQISLREAYPIQIGDGRQELLKHILSVFHGENFSFKPDTIFLQKVAARFGFTVEPKKQDEPEEDHSPMQLGLDYLANTPLNIFPGHHDSTMTVKEAVEASTGDEQLRLLEEVVFGKNSSDYYVGVTAHIQKLLSSDSHTEYFFGYLLNQTVLELASTMERQL